nr:ribonuclease H-like domain-containing protein [Tanacetum cinerariifolium]
MVLDLSKVANPLYSLRVKDLFKSKDPQVVGVAAKLPILNPNEFDLWKMRIEQYFLMTDYSLWEVILNGDSPTPTRIVDGVVQVIAPTTAEQQLAKKNELKARGTLLMALHNKHQLKINIRKDAKSLMKAIEKRFGGNKETKKVQKTLLKQQYENFSGTSSKSLDQIHDRLQKLISQLEILADLEEQSLDDLFNNLKIYEAEVKGSSTSSHNTQKIAFVSSNNTDSTNKSVNVVPSVSVASFQAPVSTLLNVDSLSDVVIYSFFASQSNSTQLENEDLKQIDADYLEEKDLKWQMAMLTMRARMFLQKTERNLCANRTAAIGFDMSKFECYNCHRRCHFSRDCRSPRDNRNKDTPRRTVPVEADEEHTNYALMAYASSCSSSSPRSDNEVAPCSKACSKAYATLQSHYDILTVDFRKSQIDVLSYKTVTNWVNIESSSHKPSKDMSKTLSPDAPIIEDWISDSKDEFEIESVPKQKEPSFVLTSKHVKTPRASVKPVKNPKQAQNLRTDNQKSRCHKNSWNMKACFIGKSLYHLIKDCDYYEKEMVQKPVWNHAMRVNHQTSARMAHPHSNRNVVPTAVLTRSGLVSLNVFRLVSTVVPQTTVKSPRPVKHVVNKAHSPIRRPINHRPTTKNSNFNQKVTTVKANKIQVSHGLGPQKTIRFLFDVQGNPQQALEDKSVIDSGCSRHMTGNISYLSDFEEFNGGYVAFGGNPKGGKISGKGKIKTGKLDFNEVYFVKELKFNLFSVSSMCDKKNSVLFTDTECVVLYSDYKLPDENHVLLRVPQENNMYNVDLKNVVPSGDLTCLFAKATLDESNLWHRRLGHINFKTINKLVKGNLVRGLPSKIFKNDHTCVACKKGKQHRASCKSKPVSSVSYPLQRVLVTKPHNNTPYELLLGKTPSIGFMRPFGCLVTILNTLYPIGKFDGKADEGFLVGYSVNSKAFRVFNSRTRIVQETLHINFLKTQPNVVGSGPKWLFNINTLTQSMNYQPVVAGNQPNHNAGIKENLDTCKVRKEIISAQQYELLPLWSTGLKDPQNTYDVVAFDVKENENEVYVSPSGSDKTKKHDDKAKRADKRKSHVDLSTGVRDLRGEFEEFSVNSTNRVNAASALVTAAGPNPTNGTNNFNTANMPVLEDIVYSDYEENVGAEADLSNLETNIYVSPIPTTRVHKDHPVTQIIGDLTSAPQTRSMAKMVWVLVDLPKGKRAIGSKWVFRNKKDERGIMIRNKARLVQQGHTQEEGIDYDEVFAPVARIEAIRLFLAYASFMGFMVYQMDVKIAFLYGTIEEKVYVCQPPRFEDLDYLDKVYNMVKALYGLHQAPRA